MHGRSIHWVSWLTSKGPAVGLEDNGPPRPAEDSAQRRCRR